MAEVRVAIIGLGNVGSTFVQGIDYYGGKDTVGLWHKKIAGLKPSNVRVVAAFDIDPVKVGKNMSQVASESTKYRSSKDSRITVSPGMLSDINSKVSSPVKTSAGEFVRAIKKSGAQVALNLISSGLDRTSVEYAKAALRRAFRLLTRRRPKIATNAAAGKEICGKQAGACRR